MPLAEFGEGGPVQIAVINAAKTPLGVDLGKLVAALQVQIDRDFFPVWAATGNLYIATDNTAADPADWQLVFLDDADQAGALGYHEVTEAGAPIMKVFVATTISDGELVAPGASHELLEGLADPAINTLRMDGTNTIYIQEVSDPVQADTYEIDDIPMSSFVYPSWFEPFRKKGSVKFDHLGTVDSPFDLATGGWISVLRRGRWTQIFGSTVAAERFNLARKHRAQVLLQRVPAHV